MKEREPRMNVLISEKSKQRFKFGAIVMIFLALIVLFVVRYQIVNGKVLHHVKHEVIPYGENYEMADITYNIQKSPVWRKIYDEDYRMKILKIPPMKILEIPATYHKIYQTGQLHR